MASIQHFSTLILTDNVHNRHFCVISLPTNHVVFFASFSVQLLPEGGDSGWEIPSCG